MLESTAIEDIPSDVRLESAALHLQSMGDSRGLIVLVDTWGEHGLPTAAARLAQVRALLAMGLMDPAWSRLQTLDPTGPHRGEVLRLTGRMFVQRGWPVRARQPIQKALKIHPTDPDLLELKRLAELPPITPATQPPALNQPPEELLGVVRGWLATGSNVKAKGLLEAMKRSDPNSQAVDLLLWGLSGDYISDEPLAQLVQQWAPGVGSLIDLTEDADLTEAREGASPEPSDSSPGFPSLFRRADEDPPDLKADPHEVTRSTPMTHHAEHAAHDTDEDTQVLFVVRPGAGALFKEPPPSPHDTASPQEFDDEEEEDRDRIVHTGTRTTDPITEEVPVETDERERTDLPWVQLDDAPVPTSRARIWALTLVGVCSAGVVFVALVALLKLLSMLV